MRPGQAKRLGDAVCLDAGDVTAVVEGVEIAPKPPFIELYPDNGPEFTVGMHRFSEMGADLGEA